MEKKSFLVSLAALLGFALIETAHAQWKLQTTLSGSPPLYTVSVVNRDVAWIFGDAQDDVYRTLDGGKTWMQSAQVTTTDSPVTGTAFNTTIAFVGAASHTANAGIYRTRDGGQSWQRVYLPPRNDNSYWNWIHFFDMQNGIAECDQGIPNRHFLIVKTNDGGNTWTPIANQPTGNGNVYGLQNGVYFFDNLNGWFGTFPASPQSSAGQVYRTIDGGNTWTAFNSGNTSWVTAVRFISPLVGIRTSVAAPFLTRSIDGGQTWATVSNLPVANIQRMLTATVVNTPSANQLWVSGDAGPNFTPFILTSIDGGVTWQEQTVADISGNSVNHLSAVSFGAASDSVQAFGVGSNFDNARGGQILNYRQRIGNVTTVQDEQPNMPVEFALEQNYPNPFNPTTNIRYQLQKSAQVSLKVYDALGREVRALVDERIAAGAHVATWDGKDGNHRSVSSGLYVYKLRADQVEFAKRMVLVR